MIAAFLTQRKVPPRALISYMEQLSVEACENNAISKKFSSMTNID